MISLTSFTSMNNVGPTSCVYQPLDGFYQGLTNMILKSKNKHFEEAGLLVDC